MPMAFGASGDLNNVHCTLVCNGFWFTNMVLDGSDANEHFYSIVNALQLPRWSTIPFALPWAIWSLPVVILLGQLTWFKLQTL